MKSVLKSIAKGAFYFLFFPFGLLAIALYAVFGLFVFVFQFIRLIVLFFTGRNLQSDLPEDIEAKAIMQGDRATTEEKQEEQSSTDNSLSLYPSDSIVYGSGYVYPSDNNTEKKEESSDASLENKEGGNNNV